MSGRLFLEFLDSCTKGGHKTPASEPGLTSEAGCPHGRRRDRTESWGGSRVALTLVPKTWFPTLRAGGDDTAPGPGRMCEPSVAPGPGGLGSPLHLHLGGPVPSWGRGGLWPCPDTAHAAHRPRRAGAEAGQDTPGARVGAVGTVRSAGDRARQPGSRGLPARLRPPEAGTGRSPPARSPLGHPA